MKYYKNMTLEMQEVYNKIVNEKRMLKIQATFI